MRHRTLRHDFAFLAVMLIFMLCRTTAADEWNPDDLFAMSFDELVKVYVTPQTERTLLEAPGIVLVVTEQEIRNSGAKSMEEVLRQLPGFYVCMNSDYPIT